MKRFCNYLVLFLLLLAGVIGTAIGTRGEEPTWIQYSEPLAGANSPNFTDVLNRPAMTIWNNFLVEHEVDGYHNYSALVANMDIDMSSKTDVTTFETEHNPDGSHTTPIPTSTSGLSEGTNLYYTEARVSANSSVSANTTHRGRIDNPHGVTTTQIGAVTTAAHAADLATKVNTTTFTVEHNTDGTHNLSIPSPSEYALRGTGSSYLASNTMAPTGLFTAGAFSVWGVVTFQRLNVAESLFLSVSTEYTETIIECFKNSQNRPALTLGSTTYTSSTLLVSTINRPTEFGCVFTGSQVFFFVDGETDAVQAASASFPTIDVNEQWVVGDGLQGDVLYLSASSKAIRSASSWFTPYTEGLSQCPACIVQYDMDEQSGSALYDNVGTRNLTIYGTWQEYAGGY